VLQTMTLDDVLSFAKRFWKFCRLEGLIHGNVSAQHAYDITNMVWRKTHPSLPKSTEAIITRVALDQRVVDLSLRNETNLDTSSSFLYRFSEFNEANSNSCVEIIFQMGVLDMATNAKLAFVNHVVREPAFNQLRTEEQLGYIVHTSVKTSGANIKSLLFLIQSDSFAPDHVEKRIEVFIAKFRESIAKMSTQVFQTNVDTVVASLLEKNKNLGEESTRYWHVIQNHTYQFKRLQMMAEHVKSLNKEQVLQFFDRYIASNGPSRRKLCIQVFAKQHEDVVSREKGGCDGESAADARTYIDHPAEFKRSMPLFAMPSAITSDVVELGIMKE
jgi:insulysin